MKGQLDDSNYEGMITKLNKGTVEEKSACLNRFIFLYENARSRIYLYERRITECLELLLLMEEKDIATCTLKLLEKIIINTTLQSQIFAIVKKRLLSKIVLNLGSVDINTRKISHKCILEYVRKSRDFDAIVGSYIKTAIQQTQNFHLKLKSINSLHSLIIAESKFFIHAVLNTQILLEELIYSSYQKTHIEIRRAALLCLIETLRIDGSEMTLKIICSTAQKHLYDLKQQNVELASLLELIMKYKSQQIEENEVESEAESAQSPKFMSFSEEDLKKQLSQINHQENPKTDKIQENQLKVLNDVSFAEEFLKKLQKNQAWEINQIKQFAPFLEKYLVDESIKLFSISKKIVETIFDAESEDQREYYVVLVPCVVNGIGNKRFIVRKNLDKLVRQYLKNHTEVWVQSFIQKFANTTNIEVKKILIDLFLHAYRTSPQFYHPSQRTFSVLERQIKDYNSNLKWKAVDCLITVIEKQAKNQKDKEDMLSTLSPEVYNKVLRKMNKTHTSIGSNPGSVQHVSPSQKMKVKQRRRIRLTTDEPRVSIEKSVEKQRTENVSQEKSSIKNFGNRERRTRKSQIDIDFKARKPRQQTNHGNQEQKQPPVNRLPELKRGKVSLTNAGSVKNQSPVKKAMGEKNIMYVDKQNLPQMIDPKTELEKALIMIRDSSWNTQFESINSLRSVIEYHKELVSEQYFNIILTELLQCLNNLRSGVSKISLICLGELLRKFHKKAYSFTEQIITTLIKKNMTTSEFIQEEIKRCIMISVDELCSTRMVSTLNSFRDTSKGSDMKISILGIIEAMSKNDRIYKKQIEWIWCILIDFHEDHNLQVKIESRKIAKTIIENKKQWKSQISSLKPNSLQKIDKIIKGMMIQGSNSTQNAWLESENKELNKIITSKLMTAKYFVNQFSKFEDVDRSLNMKKNFKERSRLLNSMFSIAFEHGQEFEKNQNAKKYIFTALDHLDDKNPGMLLNAINILSKSVQNFPQIMEECLSVLFEKMLPLVEIKKVQIGSTTQKFIDKLYRDLDPIKACKQLLKLILNVTVPIKVRSEALSQVIGILRQAPREEIAKYFQLEPLILKILTKSTTETIAKDPSQLTQSQSPNSNYQTQLLLKQNRIRQLMGIGMKRFSQDFCQKIKSSHKLSQILQGNSSPTNKLSRQVSIRQSDREGERSKQKERYWKKNEGGGRSKETKIRLISSEQS